MTGITNEELLYGFSFSFAFRHFAKWCGTDFSFLTWGLEDIKILRGNMALHNLDADQISKTYDVQMIFSDQITKAGHIISLAKAMAELGEPALDAHDALNDARNTMCVCSYLDMASALVGYDELVMRMERLGKNAVDKEWVKKIYASKLEALAAPELYDFNCPLCGSKVICEKTVKQNSPKYICIGTCEHSLITSSESYPAMVYEK